jgi:4-amino-4-deoxy-L-arabinose transferase-like glycosyltransferase
VFFLNLGQRSLWEPDEGRYAQISREMVESGDWLTPRLNYIKHFDKPPITYWLIGASFKLLGQNEFSAHLPLALVGLGGVLVTFLLGKKMFGPRCGFCASVILISSLGYPALSRILSTDIVFSFFCLLCYLFFIQKNYPLFYVSLALGFMTKGPVVFVITLIPICALLIFEKDRSTFKRMHLIRGLVLSAALGLPWYIHQILLNKGLLYDWTYQQTLNRIIRQIQQPFYFFIPVLIGLFFPWIFFTIFSLRRKLIFNRAPLEQEQTKILILFFWFIIPFIFFSAIGKKLVPYMLPLLPPLAIITARAWEEVIDSPHILKTKAFAISYYVFLSSLVLIFVSLIVFLRNDFNIPFEVARIRPNIIAISIILAAAIIVSLSLFKLKKVVPLFWTIAFTSSLFFFGVIDILPKIETDISKSIKPLALKIKEDLRPQDKVVNYRCFLKSLPFYLKRRTIVVERERNLTYEKTGHWQDYLIKDKEEFYRLLSARDSKVFCITYTWEFKEIREEYSRPLYFLGRAGKYVLFVNRI